MRNLVFQLGSFKPAILVFFVGVSLALSIRGMSQEKSVRPGINSAFQNPNPSEFLERFETESREIYSLREEILGACDFQTGSVVGDIGAGTGLFSRLIGKKIGPSGKLVAVDIAQNFLDHVEATAKSQGLGNVSTQLCNQESCLIPPNTLDVAFVCDTYHHFEYPQKTTESIFKALKPNGKLILIDLDRIPGVSTEWALGHVRANKATVLQEIESCGFRKINEVDIGLKENYFVVFGKQQDHSSKTKSIAPITESMRGFVSDQEIAGAVTLVIDGDSTVHLDAAGYSDVANKLPMQTDSIFWIASMTKPVTAACVMMLVDDGKVSLADPISKYLPEMAELKTLDGKKVEITIEQVLNHTSGMSEIPDPQTYADINLAEAAAKYSKLPVQFAPGSKWQYSQTGINTGARIVEVVSGKTFDEFVQERLFKPLGMNDTTFYLSEEQTSRLAKSYSREKDGSLKESPIFLLAGHKPSDRNRLPAANGGLFSTAEDYGRFCQMLLNEGKWMGQSILSAKSVERLRTPTTGALVTGFTTGNAWGVGCCIVRNPMGATEYLSKGTYGHGGAYGTQAWIDPVKKRCFILMVQRANFPNADDSQVRKTFQRLAVESLESAR